MSEKTKVAILGGGYGALTTAWYLTRTPELQAKYDVTVHQLGWRLGGKGATARNASFGERIEEHGLHVWYGYYDNAFALIQEAYDYCRENALAPLSPFQNWRDAFRPQQTVTIMDSVAGPSGPVWSQWDILFPQTPGVPGDGSEVPALEALILHALKKLLEIFETTHVNNADGVHRSPLALSSDPLHSSHTIWSLLKEAVAAAEEALEKVGIILWKPISGLLRLMHDHILHDLQNIAQHSDFVRRMLYFLDLGIPAIIGCIETDAVSNGLDSLNDLDLREFLAQHGAVQTDSPVIKSLYDGIFAFEDGDPTKPNLAAGTALHGIVRLFFTYKEAPCYEMRAGMGETVVSPLYLGLVHKGVKFRFFERVRNLELSPDKHTINAIEIIPQATVSAGPDAYKPLRTVNNLPCWPEHPNYDQLIEGAALQASGANLESNWNDWDPKRTPTKLTRGTDFDLVVLGIPTGAHRQICAELIDANSGWQNMVDKVTTVSTFAFQLWLTEDVASTEARNGDRVVSTSFVDPVQNWADMTNVLKYEAWSSEARVKSIQYFFGPFEPDPAPDGPDPAYAERQLDKVRALATDFLKTGLPPIFQAGGLQTDGSLDWSKLATPTGCSITGPEALRTQFIRANIDASELYVLSCKRSIAARLDPGNSGFHNLFLAGDWTTNVMNCGCIEGTVSSAMACARAITNLPLKIIGEQKGTPAASGSAWV